MIGGKKKKKMKNSNKEEGSVGEVEEMLRAAEEDLLLKLTVNTHSTAKASTAFSSSILDPDLDRRFDALKFPPSSAGNTKVPLGKDDISARLAALKASSSSSSSSSSSAYIPEKTNRVMGRDDVDDDGDKDEDGVSKKEVDKVIQWAIDAARLDPSGRDDDEVASESEEEDEDEEDKRRSKGKPKKWFFF